MSRRGNARGNRFSWTLHAAACLLLAVIAADVAADSTCDDASTGVTYATITGGAGASGTNEPCSDFCVPDCFCCSRTTAAAPVVLPPEPQCFAPVDGPAAELWPEGVRPVVDHPPLARA